MYAGEVVRVTFVGQDFDGTPITPTNAAAVTASVYDVDDRLAQADDDMVWDAEVGEWSILWDTDQEPAGGYVARITVHSFSGGVSLGFKRMQLMAPVAGPYPGGTP